MIETIETLFENVVLFLTNSPWYIRNLAFSWTIGYFAFVIIRTVNHIKIISMEETKNV